MSQASLLRPSRRAESTPAPATFVVMKRSWSTGIAHRAVAPAPSVSRLTRIWGVAHVETDADDELIEKIGRIVHERCPVANMVVASGCSLEIEWRRAEL